MHGDTIDAMVNVMSGFHLCGQCNLHLGDDCDDLIGQRARIRWSVNSALSLWTDHLRATIDGLLWRALPPLAFKSHCGIKGEFWELGIQHQPRPATVGGAGR